MLPESLSNLVDFTQDLLKSNAQQPPASKTNSVFVWLGTKIKIFKTKHPFIILGPYFCRSCWI